MQIKDLYKKGSPVISFEVFPPKKDSDIDEIYSVLGQMTELSPDFISVTYGAGGTSTSSKTAEIASFIQDEYDTCSLAHLTCVGARRDSIKSQLDSMKSSGITNVLALRGDLPNGELPEDSYHYAEELISDIREQGGFCIGAACYPEGHIDCPEVELDTSYMLRKQQMGADFLITQLFFENDYFYRFIDRARSSGVSIPISAGIMPILSRKQIERMIFMCGVSLPSGIIRLLHKYESSPNDLRSAGIEYATKQAENLLANGVDGVHFYTMNRPEIAQYCMTHIDRPVE